jgi:hypothetical protein
MAWMAQACALLACFFLAALAILVIYLIVIGRIDLSQLLSEANGDASMSRFQLLIFTFVVAISLFKLVELKGQFPDIPNGILTLMGISASTYAVGKGISYSAEVGISPKAAREAKKKDEAQLQG